jgi:hypothetical protein
MITHAKDVAEFTVPVRALHVTDAQQLAKEGPVDSEATRVGQAHGDQLEEILHLPPETIALAGEGDEAAMRACDEQPSRTPNTPPPGNVPPWARTYKRPGARRSNSSTVLWWPKARRSGLRQGQCRVDRHRQACRTQRAEPGSAAHHRVAAELSRLAPRLPDGRLGAFEMYSPVRSSFIEVDRT